MIKMADNYANSSKRKTYIRGKKMKIELSITNYVDDVMLQWLNSRAVVTSSIWELVKKEAYREAAMNSQGLGVFNNHIQEVPKVNTISQIEQPAYQDNQPLQINASESADISKTNMDYDKISKNSEINSGAAEDKDNVQTEDKAEQVEHAEQQIVENKVTENNNSEEIAFTDSKILDEGSNKKTDDSNSGKLDLTNKFKKKKKVSTLIGSERPLSAMEKLTLGIKD